MYPIWPNVCRYPIITPIYILVERTIPDLVHLYCYNNLQSLGAWLWGFGATGALARSGSDIRKPEVQSSFQFISEVCSEVEVRALCRSLEFIDTPALANYVFLLCAQVQCHAGNVREVINLPLSSSATSAPKFVATVW